MENEILDWACVVCPKSVKNEGSGRERKIENRYKIAVDVMRLDGDSFVCPCCGEELTYEILTGARIPEDIRDEIVSEKQDGSLKNLKSFAVGCGVLVAGIAGWMFLGGDTAVLAGYILLLLFALAWLPALVYMLWTAFLLRDREKILRAYEKANPVIVSLKDKKDNRHRFEDFPEIYLDGTQVHDYGLGLDR